MATAKRERGGGAAAGPRLSADEIRDNVFGAACEELERPSRQLFWSALDAGLSIGFSFLAAAWLASVAAPHLRGAAPALGYPLGFVFVVLARSQLFTENTLEPVIPLLERRDGHTLRRMLRLWAIVLAGNLLGALVFAVALAWTPMVQHPLAGDLDAVAEAATRGGFAVVAWRAIFAGWLVALMAWLVAATTATGAQIALVWLTTAPIAAFGLAHSIAGSTEAFYRALVGSAGWGAMLGGFVAPAILGNIVGGVTLVALLNHAQVHHAVARRG